MTTRRRQRLSTERGTPSQSGLMAILRFLVRCRRWVSRSGPSATNLRNSLPPWSLDPACALVPAFYAQPLLEGMQMDLRIRSAQGRNVSLVSSFVEPSEHRIKLLAQQDPNDGKRKFLELYRLAQHTAENLRSFRICQLASGNLQLFSYELVWALE